MVNFDPKLLDDKILNLDKIMKLSETDRKSVLDLFERLTKCFNGNNGIPLNMPGIGGVKLDLITAKMIYNTLVEHDYLITRREKRLEDVLEK
jgi:hypothetical protein